MVDAALDVPEAGQLVRVRGQQWVVAGLATLPIIAADPGHRTAGPPGEG